MIHRDIKAANLLINNEGTLQIADFGLIRSIHPESVPGPAKYTREVVTRWYRPPEVLLSDQNYGPPVDMWGIGCVMAEMFIQHPLFAGESDVDQAFKIFDLCGSPDVGMPGFELLPGVYSTKDDHGKPVNPQNKWPHKARRVYERFSKCV
jgi:serine/threonine protein kinase